MKKSIILIFIFFSFASAQQDKDSCDFLLREFLEYSKLETVYDSTLIRTEEIMELLKKNNCYKHSDELVIKTAKGEEYIGGLTYLFGQICLASDTDKGVKFYVNYLNDHKNSAEEELSFAFERIFQRKPSTVLKCISESDSISQIYLLDEIVWGFVNNRMYGVESPFVDYPDKAFIFMENPPPVKLTVETYKDIFFQLNSQLEDLKLLYPKEIGYILNRVHEFLIKYPQK